MFKEIDVREIKENAVKLICDDWGLVTAGDEEKLNTMTVSWGAIGELWKRDMVTVYIRPQRYTKEFLDAKTHFTLSFYPEELKDIHKICGVKSGRDVDKVKECNLTPNFSENAPYFEEAKLVIVCKKVARSRFELENFIDPTIDSENYHGDYHYVYYGEIEKVLISE